MQYQDTSKDLKIFPKFCLTERLFETLRIISCDKKYIKLLYTEAIYIIVSKYI